MRAQLQGEGIRASVGSLPPPFLSGHTAIPARPAPPSSPPPARDEVRLSKAVLPPTVAPVKAVPCDGQVKTVTFVYDPDGHNLSNLTLMGSWDTNSKRYATEWKNSAVAMTKGADGRWTATVNLLNDATHPWQWGVLADGPNGKQQWAIFEEDNLNFSLQAPNLTNQYAPTTYTRMGATRDGNDVKFRYWAPYAREVQVKIWADNDQGFTPAAATESVPLVKDPASGMWTGALAGGWDRCANKPYAYQLVTREGAMILRADPYARQRQGQQRGIAQFYLHPVTGREVNPVDDDPVQKAQGKPSRIPFIRFEVQGHAEATEARLVLRDEGGRAMDKDALLARLGAGSADLVRQYHDGKFSDYWSDNIQPDGSIGMVKQGTAWACVLNNPAALAGLSYTFEVRGQDGKLLGDANGDGRISDAEARAVAFNDPYSGQIDGRYGWERFGLVGQPDFQWKNDNAPRMATDRSKFVVYELHVGSLLGDAKNVQRSSFQDVQNQLSYLKDLGVNTIELMPINSIESSRDWGYIGTYGMGVTDQYGFEDHDGRWVGGLEAVKRLVDEAHGQGFNVTNDVVYNHWGQPPDHLSTPTNYNDLWQTDGTKNPYFDWGTDPNAKDAVLRPNQFGPLPAYNKDAVRQFIVDSANVQLDELHFDGLRLDFTHPIHEPGGGGNDGWTLLRKTNRELHFFHPGTWINAEEFPNSEVVTQPAYSQMQGGAGFDTMWNTEFQHRLVHGFGEPSILQQAASGRQTNIDSFMNHLVSHPGFKNLNNQTTIVTDHDEVGNADRTVTVAMDHRTDELPGQWARNACRLTFGVGVLSPGTALLFQGEESLARNTFKWAVPSTWDLGWDWRSAGRGWDFQSTHFGSILNRINPPPTPPPAQPGGATEGVQKIWPGSMPPRALSAQDGVVLKQLSSASNDELYNVMRKLHFNFSKDAIALRQSSTAFDGDAEVARVYTHNDNSVMAFSRKKGNDQFVVVASLNRYHLPNYNMPLPEGKWQLVLSSNDEKYGGDGWGGRQHVDGGNGSRLDIPSGGLLVYRRVG